MAADALISSVLSMPVGRLAIAGAAGTTSQQLLEFLELDHADEDDVLEFFARLNRHALGCRPGTVVDVRLDLLHSNTIEIGRMKWPVQLLLGQPHLDGAELRAVMGISDSATSHQA